MLLLPLASIWLAAAPAVTACETPVGEIGTICTEVQLAKNEDAAPFTERCRKANGVSKPSCGAKPNARCVMGDTALSYNLAPGKKGDEAAGFLEGGRTSCFGHGGSFEPKPKATAKPPVALALPGLKASTKGAGDCGVEEELGSFKLTCGGVERPELSVTVLAYTGEIGQPKKAESVVADLKDDVPGATVKELSKKKGKDGTWQVQYSAAAAHGATTFGFDEVRSLGTKKLLCVGSAWNQADLDAAVKMCGSIVAAK